MTVSLCIIAYNEERVIGGLLSQVLEQTYPHEQTEIVLVDNGSQDSTGKIMAEFARQNSDGYIDIKTIDNQGKGVRLNQASGWNTAISYAAGDIIIRVDAHAEIPRDFIEQNVRLIESGEDVCGGARPNRIDSPTPFKEMLFLAESSMFGSSIAGYRRQTDKKKYVSSVFHGAYRRSVFANVGGFNEDLGRTEDNELHYRIQKAGYRICQSEDIISYQHIRGTLSSMLKQKYSNGKWIGMTFGVCKECLSIYHFVPFAFVTAIMAGIILMLIGVATGTALFYYPLCLLMGAYLLADVIITLTSVLSSPKKNITMLLLPSVFFLLHIAYGIGTAAGLIIMPSWRAGLDGSAQKRIEEVKASVSKNTIGMTNGGKSDGNET